jgi:23S rRNA (uracil1939-C5)-methyltransferase
VYKREGKRIVSGIYKSTTHSVMAADNCAICSELANRVSGELCRLFQSFKIAPYDPYTGRGWLRSVIIREARATGESMAVIIGVDSIFPAKRTFATALKKACPELSTAVCAVNSDPDRLFGGRQTEVLFGDGKITDILCGERFIISASSFYQINRAQTERLYTKAIELAALTGGETVLDAYCGVGTIGITASRKAGRVLAVELNPEAIRNARSNAELNGIENISFTAADSRLYAKELQERGERVDVAFVDPPRAGCTAGFLKSLSRLSPERIVYISCNPETQARDIRVLGRLGYKAQVCYPFDMFPHTKHVESVCMMSHEKPHQ